MVYKKKQLIGRRGEGHIWITLSAILALVILVFVFYSLFIKTGAPLADFYKNLPGFGQSIPKVKDVEMVRYDLVSGEIRFYDGENWNMLKSKAQLNNKEVMSATLDADFYKFFYNTPRKRNDYLVANSYFPEIKGETLSNYVSDKGKRVVFQRPVVKIFGSEKGLDPLYIFGYAGSLYSFEGNSGSSMAGATLTSNNVKMVTDSKILSSNLLPSVVEWGDGIFKGRANPKAVDLRYNIVDGKTTTPDTKKFCVEKHDKYMVVRLNEPVTSDLECK